jgi:KaiC/GvpD/RAD55 family RecA-like ATPase
MEFAKPLVTIELDEYQTLKQYAEKNMDAGKVLLEALNIVLEQLQNTPADRIMKNELPYALKDAADRIKKKTGLEPIIWFKNPYTVCIKEVVLCKP